VFGKEYDRGVAGVVAALGERLVGNGAPETIRGGGWLGFPVRAQPQEEGGQRPSDWDCCEQRFAEEDGGAQPLRPGPTPPSGQGANRWSPERTEQPSREELARRARQVEKSRQDSAGGEGHGERKKTRGREDRFGRLVLD